MDMQRQVGVLDKQHGDGGLVQTKAAYPCFGLRVRLPPYPTFYVSGHAEAELITVDHASGVPELITGRAVPSRRRWLLNLGLV